MKAHPQGAHLDKGSGGSLVSQGKLCDLSLTAQGVLGFPFLIFSSGTPNMVLAEAS